MKMIWYSEADRHLRLVYDINAKGLKRAQNVLSGPQELRCQYGDEDKNDDMLVLCSGRIRC